MKFGKQIQAQQVPGWSSYYLDYKFLKKIISSLAANRPASEAAALALGVRPADVLTRPPPDFPSDIQRDPGLLAEDGPGEPPMFPASDQDDDRGPDFHAHKAAFFFKLERELEKINAFYLQKEAELTLRLETLLSKRRAAAMRVLPDSVDDPTENHVEWSAVEEGFRLLERDLGKLEQFIEMNAVGFRKILKKWDKRSKSATKEMYLARQVDAQPVFNGQLISELSETVAACLLNLTDLSTGVGFEGPASDILTQQIAFERASYRGPFRDLETNLRRAVASSDETLIRELIHYSDALAQETEGRSNVTRILWKIITGAPPELADLILSSLETPFDFLYVDDINGRTCLHEAAISGSLRSIDICLEKGVQVEKTDVYGRTALHYACMKGHADVCRRLVAAKSAVDVLDMDNYNALIYATLGGSVDCLKVLLEEESVADQLVAPSGDLIPLSLASQAGHADVVMLLLQYGATCMPNSNGEYPMHLAAREGHADVCQLLLLQTGWDTPDRYHEWTPLVHAARYGHERCIEILLEAGARIDVRDEFGHSPAHYAAWYGHHGCVSRILASLPTVPDVEMVHDSPPTGTPSAGQVSAQDDVDQIPSLSLPPPIMPHRVYGHNYLDKSYLIQITIGHSVPHDKASSGRESAVRLHPRLTGTTANDQYLLPSTPLKLVMTSPDANSAPYSIPLPQQEEKGFFSFQISSLDAVSLEFSICPRVGTKTLGRNICIPAAFQGIENSHPFVLPILDNRLHIIGEVSFEVNFVAPFNGVTLEVGGAVETYWKSMMLSHLGPRLGTPTRILSSPPMSGIGSIHTSPSVHSVTGASGQTLTISSLSGDYLYLVVQVTRDLHPVIFSDWVLPETGFDLGVADVSLAQFEDLAKKLGRELCDDSLSSIQDWRTAVRGSMVSLAHLMLVLPVNFGLSLELAYPSQTIVQRLSLGRRLDLNLCVDAFLRTIYHTSSSAGILTTRRRLNFTSFSPDTCAALNWKQPNYPVFFSSHCGLENHGLLGPTAMDLKDDPDRRLFSLSAAVEFAKSNNLLGIFVNTDILDRVPSLIQSVRNAGLLIGAYGSTQRVLVDSGESTPDAFLCNGIVVYKVHSSI